MIHHVWRSCCSETCSLSNQMKKLLAIARLNNLPLTSNVAGVGVEHWCVAFELQKMSRCEGRGTSASEHIYVRRRLLIIALVAHINNRSSSSVRSWLWTRRRRTDLTERTSGSHNFSRDAEDGLSENATACTNMSSSIFLTARSLLAVKMFLPLSVKVWGLPCLAMKWWKTVRKLNESLMGEIKSAWVRKKECKNEIVKVRVTE